MNAGERVDCLYCHQQSWKEECHYFNLGNGCEGYICEPCKQHEKERLEMLHGLLQKRIKKALTNPEEKLDFEFKL